MEIEPERQPFSLCEKDRIFYKRYAPWIVSSTSAKERLLNFQIHYLPQFIKFRQEIAHCKKFPRPWKAFAMSYIQLRLKIEYSVVDTIIFEDFWLNFDEYLKKDWDIHLFDQMTQVQIENYLISRYNFLRLLSMGKLHEDCREIRFFSSFSTVLEHLRTQIDKNIRSEI